VSGSARIRLEQINAVTDSVLEQWRPDCIITTHHMEKAEAGFKGLYIRETTLTYDYITQRIAKPVLYV